MAEIIREIVLCFVSAKTFYYLASNFGKIHSNTIKLNIHYTMGTIINNNLGIIVLPDGPMQLTKF